MQSSRGSEEVQLKGERTTRDKGARRSVGGKGKKKEERRVSRQERYKEMVQVGRGGNEGEVGGFGGKVESEVAVAGSAHMVEVVAAGSIRARPVLNIESHGAMLCRIVARALLHVVRVTVLSDKGRKTYQGLVTEVLNHQPADDTFNSSLQAEHTFCLLAKEGLMISVAVSSVEELVVLTLAGSPDLAALHHAATSTQSGGGWGRARNTLLTPTLHAMVLQPPFLVPAEAMDDENLILLRSLGESYGRRVLVQNLRHVLVGLSGYRALWSDFLMLTSLVQESSSSSSSSRPPPSPTASVFVHGLGAGRGFAGEGGIQGWVDLKRRGWMVKVLPDVETYREAVSLGGVDGKWVSVSEILPMSDYDLETYNTYRHQVLPSSEFDLQRHDSALHLRYSSSSSSSDYDV